MKEGKRERTLVISARGPEINIADKFFSWNLQVLDVDTTYLIF
jgi:hypothetical protein